jgi:hypothetical protein
VEPYQLRFRGTYLPPGGADAILLNGVNYLGTAFDVRLTAEAAEFTCYQSGNDDMDLIYEDAGLTFPFICDGIKWFQ